MASYAARIVDASLVEILSELAVPSTGWPALLKRQRYGVKKLLSHLLDGSTDTCLPFLCSFHSLITANSEAI